MKIINLTRLLEPTRLRLQLVSRSAWPVRVQTIVNGKNTTSTDGKKPLFCISLVKKEGKPHYLHRRFLSDH